LLKTAACPVFNRLWCVVALLLGGHAAAQQACDTKQFPPSSPTARFEDNADGTVTDTASKLMWLRCSDGQQWANGNCAGLPASHSWQSAEKRAAEVNRLGIFFFNDWRLPQLRELATITERQCKNPRVNLAVFPQTPPAHYWTASSRANQIPQNPDGFAFAVAFDVDGMRYADKQDALHVRLVRNAR
jgi:hypothetical protein